MTADARGFGRGTLWGVCLVALSILVLQVALTRLLSVVMWYHFAFVAISLAMMGLALGGILLYLRPALLAATPTLVPWLCRAAALTTVGALAYVVSTPIDTAASGAFNPAIAVFYVVALLPFLASGLALSAVLAYHADHIDRLYFYDLLGAGAGCVLVVALLEVIGAPATVLLSAVLVLAGGGLLGRPGRRTLDAVLGLALVGLLGVQISREVFEPDAMHGVSDESWKEVVSKGWNSHSRVVVSRVDDGLMQINIDGHATTGCRKVEGPATPEAVREQLAFLMHRGAATAYAVAKKAPKVVIIGPGGGMDILAGLGYDAEVTAVELNGLIYDLMTEGPLVEWSGGVYTADGVRAVHDEARSWIRRSDEKFDLVMAVMVDTWAATSAGAFALAENALYTVEAFEDFFDHLTDEGVVQMSRWHPETAAESLRTVVLMTEVMKRRGITEPADHVVVLIDRIVNGPAQAIMLWSRQPFTPQALERLERHILVRRESQRLTKECWPGMELDNDLSRYLHSDDREAFLAALPRDVSPTTDDRPFFFHTVRLGDLWSDWDGLWVNERAVVVLVSVLLVVTVLVLLAFGLPFALRMKAIRAESGRGTSRALLYFCGLGFGFMLLEIPLLQRFGLYLGHPTYTLSTILTALLVGAGCGSWLAGRLFGDRPLVGLRLALLLVLGAIVAFGALVPGLLQSTLAAPLSTRLLITLALVSPLGLLLGFPLPLGVRALTGGRRALVPWAWGMNGATSVLASVLGVVIGMHAGFQTAALVGAGGYTLALLVSGSLPGNEPADDPVPEPGPASVTERAAA